MNHVMIDLETLGTAPGGAVLTLGAVRFDPEVDDFAGLTPDQILALPPERAFYARIERESCAGYGLTEDADTLAWWSRQSHAARFEAFDARPRFGIECVIANFADWCRAIGPEVTPWSHGAVFDIAQSEHLFRLFGIPCPWDFRNVRDTRTLYAFAGVKPERDANHHHALFDAVAQTRAVIAAHRNRAAATQRIATITRERDEQEHSAQEWSELADEYRVRSERTEEARKELFDANIAIVKTCSSLRARVDAIEEAARVVCREFYQQHPLIKALDAALSAPPAPAVFDLIAHLHRQRDFSARTFGPGARAAGVCNHIRKELSEIEAKPADITEWADVILLTFDGAWRSGAEPEEIAAAIAAKQAKNERRDWPDWRTCDPDKAIEHVRGKED